MLSHKLRRYRAAAAQATDANFKQTTLLLHGDGTNGGQNNTFLAANHASGGLPGGFGVVFDGSGDYLTVPDNNAWAFSGDFTIEAWAYPTTSGTERIIASVWYGGTISNTSWSIDFQSTNKIRFIVGIGGTHTTINSTSTFSANNWYHIAAVRSGSTITLYVNGVSEGTATASGTLNNLTYALHIGGLLNGGSVVSLFNGYISNLRIVNGTAVYTANFTPPTAPLTAITNTSLLVCHASTLIDGSTNNFTITANGDAKVVTTSDSGLVVTRNGNTTQGTFSPFSVADGQWSNNFDGGASYLSTPSTALFGSGDYTVEAWIYYNAVPTNFTAILNGLSVGSLSFYYDGGRFATNRLIVSNRQNNQINYAWTPAIGTWYHLAVSRSGSTARLFIDGTQVTSVTDSTNYSTAAVYNIGYDSGVASGGTNGYISNLRAVNGTALYTANFTPPTSPLTAVTNTTLLTCQSNRFRDASTNNFTITRNSNVTVRPFSPFAPTAAYSASTNGSSIYVDGSGDTLTGASNSALSPGTGAFTFETWFYVVSFPFDAGLMQLGTQTNGLQIGRRDSGAADWGVAQATVAWRLTSSTLPTTGQWNHMVVVRDGSNTMSLFLNGSRIAFTTTSYTFTQGGFTCFNKSVGWFSDTRYVVGTAVYDPTSTSLTVPTAPLTAITNTQLLLQGANAAIIDNTGKNVLETVGNAQIDTGTKKFGTGALEFDGNGDYLIGRNNPDVDFGSGDLTIEGWVYLNGNQNSKYLFGTGTADGSSRAVHVWLGATQKIEFYFSNTGSAWQAYRLGTSTLAADTWNHIACVRNGNNLLIFINGTSEGSSQVGTPTSASAGKQVLIGGQPSNYYLNGFVDDVRITKGIARYTANFTPPTAAFADNS